MHGCAQTLPGEDAGFTFFLPVTLTLLAISRDRRIVEIAELKSYTIAPYVVVP